MKNLNFILLFSLLMIVQIACTSNKSHEAVEVENIDTGIDSEKWVKIPTGEFFVGQHRHEKMIEKEYEIMITNVTTRQFIKYLNEVELLVYQ